jgi:hypothetical protein
VSEETRNSENNTPCTAKYGHSLHFCSTFFSVIPKPPIRGKKIGEKKNRTNTLHREKENRNAKKIAG